MKRLFATLFSLGTLMPVVKAQNVFSSEFDGWCGSTNVGSNCPTFTNLMVGNTSLCGNSTAPQWYRIGTPSQPSSSSIFICAHNTNQGQSYTDFQCEGLFTSFNFVPGITYNIHVGVITSDSKNNQIKFYATNNLFQYQYNSFPLCQDPYLGKMDVDSPDVLNPDWENDAFQLNVPVPTINFIGDINLTNILSGPMTTDYVITYTPQPSQTFSQLAFQAAVSDKADGTQGNIVIDYIRIDYTCDATFTYSSSTLNPNVVTFTPNASNGAGYDWNFGDGNSLHAFNGNPVQHSYSLGSYYTCMSTSFDRNNSCNYCAPICINKISGVAPPSGSGCSSDFNYSIYSAAPNIVHLSAINPGQGGVWDFGDGTFLYGYNPSPTHTYASGGTYTICLTSYDKKGGMCSQTCATLCVGGPVTNAGKATLPSSLGSDNVVADIYPNPAQKEATLKINLPQDSDIGIIVYDATGKKVYEKEKNGMKKGINETILHTENWIPGLYYLSVKTPSGKVVKMLSVVK